MQRDVGIGQEKFERCEARTIRAACEILPMRQVDMNRQFQLSVVFELESGEMYGSRYQSWEQGRMDL